MDKSINIGCEDRLAMDERHVYPRYMGFRPADGQVCDVNPPRFSWPFDPAIIPQESLPIERRFRLRIGRTTDLRDTGGGRCDCVWTGMGWRVCDG